MVAEKVKRKLSAFEIILLIVGVIIIIAGGYGMNALIANGYGLQELIMYAGMWLIVLFMIIIAAISENSREELAIIVSENSSEIKLLREISKEHLDEIKLLRQSLSKPKKK